MAKQDPSIKGNPYSATFLQRDAEADVYRVRSAQVGVDRQYTARLWLNYPERDECNCDAPGPCWHTEAARLRQQIERVEANALALYRDWGLVELQAEDVRLRLLLAGADSWLVRGQLGVVGDLVLDRLIAGDVAA